MGAVAQLEGVGGRRMVLCDQWSPFGVVLTTPTNRLTPRVLLDQAGGTGTHYFDDVQVKPAIPLHTRTGGFQLGVGESLHTNRYLFQTRMTDFCGSYARCLHSHTATFSGDDWGGSWRLTGDAFVIYQHGWPGLVMTNAQVSVTVGNGSAGSLVLETSANGLTWQESGRLSTASGTSPWLLETNLPAGLFPAQTLFVRLRCTDTLFVTDYKLEAEISTSLPPADGNTWFFEQEARSDLIVPVAMAATATAHVLSVELRNPYAEAREMGVVCRTEGPAGTRENTASVVVSARATNEVELALPSAGAGENMARVEIRDALQGTLLLSGAMHLGVAAIRDDSFGARLPGSADCPVWWCGSTYKVGRERALPFSTNTAVQISAARNEYEPFQLVLRPEIALTNVTVSVSDFVASQLSGQPRIAATNIEVCYVEYVNVTRPTDASGATGAHPDALVPLREPFDLSPHTNQPFWITVFVPPGTPPGDYEATVTVESPQRSMSVPVRLHVYRFSLPETTHTVTAYHADIYGAWHGLTNAEQKRATWDLYLQNFRRHRISPYAPHLYAPIVWDLKAGQFKVDFRNFDAAMTRYLDDFHFNAFNVLGLKGPWVPVTLGDYERFTPEYCQLLEALMKPIMAHLRENGWAEEAYCFWYDEPQPDAIAYVLAGMRAVQAAAPGLRRVLTVSPDPALYHAVDTWVPLLSNLRYFDHASRARERLAAGDSMGWYVCMSPLAPRPNNFIDHPAINHRIRAWLAERYGVTTELYWNTTWYLDENGNERNPWEDPMSRGGPIYLGNGDGMLLYPPTRTLPTEPLVAGPINSLRWELLREGLEDGEYFWLLKEMLRRGELRLGPEHPAVLVGQIALNTIHVQAPSVSAFERDPEGLQQAREQIAAAIEALDDGAPTIIRQPRPRAVSPGETASLRVEALGWPPPAFQWSLNGTNLAHATEARLTLTNCGPEQVGEYCVVVSNPAGVITSAVVRVAGRWSQPPNLIAHPRALVRPVGETAVFAITAVSTNELSYCWLLNGVPVADAPSTNATLLLTNLAARQAGDYSAIASNAFGVVTSAVARLTVLESPSNRTVITSSSVWRYQDRGVDLGDTWRQGGYDDTTWPYGAGHMGYGDGDETTVVGRGQSPQTVYFRHRFSITNLTGFGLLTGRLLRDDGAAVYLNGTEVFRDNLPAGALTYSASALNRVDGDAEAAYLEFALPADLLQLGMNVIAVEVHQDTNDVVLSPPPAARWTFDVPASLGSDSAGTNHLGLVGTNVVSATGRIGGCATNNGSATSYLSAADAPELRYSGPFTVGGWFAFGLGSVAPAYGIQKSNEFGLYYTGTAINRYRFEVNGVAVQDQTAGTGYGQWRFVVGWYDGTNANIQVDNGNIYSTPASAPSPTANPLTVLKQTINGAGMAADDLFLFKRVLSASERAVRYQNRAETNTSDLSFAFELTGRVRQLPQLLVPPAAVACRPGDNVAFTVEAASATPLAYRWYFNSAPLANATNRLLFLRNVAPAQAGQYSVSVSNLAGAVLSSPAALSVGTPEIHARLASDGFGCTLQIPGYAVPASVLVSTNLTDWVELVQFPASFAPTNFVDTAAKNTSSRFYRLRLNW